MSGNETARGALQEVKMGRRTYAKADTPCEAQAATRPGKAPLSRSRGPIGHRSPACAPARARAGRRSRPPACVRPLLPAGVRSRLPALDRSLLPTLALSLLAAACGPEPHGPQVEKFVETRSVMSTLATITLISGDSDRAVRATEAGFAALDSVEAWMSAHSGEGDLARINAAAFDADVVVSPATFDVLRAALAAGERSGGAFDVTIGPLIQLWRRCAESGRLPTEEEIEAARARVGYRKVGLDSLRRTVRFGAPGMRIDLGGIAKGYAIDRAVAAIRDAGIGDGIVEVGGDLRCFGRIPAALIGEAASLPVRTLRRRSDEQARGARDTGAEEGGVSREPPRDFFPGLRRTEKTPAESLRAWPLGVQSPFGEDLLGKMRVPEGGVATSGHYRRHIEIDGRRYSHILDPRTGRPVGDPASVTVVAPDALTADALATALTVLGMEEGLALAESLPGVEALVIGGCAATPQLSATTGFPEILRVGQ
ncbi:MAG: hypothetical protein GF330_01055 [Candidatus Eisenbacteria bacterium]|nr:hypothetical protein [Candidatus Eisenbacteria bacterium]